MVSQQTPLPFLRDIPYIFWTIDLVSFMWHNTISSWENEQIKANKMIILRTFLSDVSVCPFD